MVYKMYIKRGGKLHGPYYYESYRDKNGKVATRYLKEHKSNTKIKNIFFYVFIFIFLLIFLLYIGNARFDYLNKVSGRVVSESGITEIREIDYDSELVSSSDKEVSSSFKDGSIQSDVDLKEKVRVEIINPEDVGIAAENPIIKFDTPDGVINLYFDLLDYNEFAKKNYDNSIITAEDFDIEIKKNPEKYKWGYDVLLKDLNFMSRIDVLSDSNITIIDDSTLKIGNNYISFSDLVKSGYSVSMNEPVILGEMIEEVEEVDDETSEERADSRIDSRSEEVSDRFVSGRRRTTYRRIVGEGPRRVGGGLPRTGSPEYGLTGSVIRDITLIGSMINFLFQGIYGLTGFTIEEPNVNVNNIVSVYVQRDFNNTNYSLGDLITLDPELVIFGGNATNGTTVYRCGEINESGTYIMNQSINQSENFDCIKIIVANVILDCGGFNVTSNLAVSGVFSNQTNTTVKNCYVDMGSGSGGFGIEFVTGTNNSQVINTTANNQRTGIYLEATLHITLMNITTNSNNHGISIELSNNNTLTNITSNSNSMGVILSSSDNNALINLTANSNVFSGIELSLSNNNTLTNITSNSNYYGIELTAISKNNTLTNITSNSNSHSGIYLSNSQNNTIKYILADSNTDAGVYLVSSNNNALINLTANSNSDGFELYTSSNNTLTNITSNSSYNHGIVVGLSSNSNILRNLNILNCSTGGSYSCIYVYASDNNLFNSLLINNSHSYGILLNSSGSFPTQNSDNNLFKDINITNIANTSVFLDDDGSNSENTNNTFLNVSYLNETVDSRSELIRKWYYRAYVNDSSGNSVSNATVLFYDNSNNLRGNLTTNSSGWTDILGLEDYAIISGVNVLYNNYTIYSYNSTHVGNISFNSTLEKNKLDSIITVSEGNFIDPSPSANDGYVVYHCGRINSSGNYTINQSISQSSLNQDCIIILSSNVTLNCQGYNITIKNCNIDMGSSSGGYGIEFSGVNNSNITNTNLSNQYSGVYFNSNFNSTLNNITTNSNIDNGVYFNSSYNNTLTNIISNSNFDIGIELSNSNNNNLTNITTNSNIDNGVYLSDSSNRLINVTSTSNLGVGISIQNNNTLTNIISNLNGDYGISIGSNNILNNITTNSNNDSGISIVSNGILNNNNILNNITTNSNSKSGIFVYYASNNSFNNINIFNCSIIGIYPCIYMIESNNNTLSSFFINKSKNYGISMYSFDSNSPASHNIFRDINITNIANTSLYLYGWGLNNTFINVSYVNESVDSRSELIRKWYYQAHVTDNSSTNVANASVLAYNVSGDLTMNLTTNATGWTPVGNITDYINSGGTRVYQSNYILAANANQTLWDSHNYNVTSSQNNYDYPTMFDLHLHQNII